MNRRHYVSPELIALASRRRRTARVDHYTTAWLWIIGAALLAGGVIALCL